MTAATKSGNATACPLLKQRLETALLNGGRSEHLSRAERLCVALEQFPAPQIVQGLNGGISLHWVRMNEERLSVGGVEVNMSNGDTLTWRAWRNIGDRLAEFSGTDRTEVLLIRNELASLWR